MARSTSLQAQISREIFSLFGAYVVGATALVMLLAIYGIYYYQKEEFKHYKALISTRLSAEIKAAFQQAEGLAQSTEVWTAMTDSAGRGSYLLPVLAQANQNPNCTFALLDYRGRALIPNENAASWMIDARASIQSAIADGRTHIDTVYSGQRHALVVNKPITANFTDGSVGLLLLRLDLGKTLASLDLPRDLQVSFRMTPSDFGTADVSTQSETFRLAWTEAGREHAIHAQLQQSYLPAFLFVTAGLVMSLVCGALLFWGLKRWTWHFSQRTTQRLAQLVELATNTLQGHGSSLEPDNAGDEISEVAHALQGILQQQRQFTQQLTIFSRVFETAAEAILITNQQGLVIDGNAALLQVTGYTREELLNQPAGRLYIQDQQGKDRLLIAQTVRAQGAWRGETYFLSKQQTPIPVLLSVSNLLDAQGRSQGHVSVFTDIRPIRRAEQKLTEMLHEDQLTGLPNYRAFLAFMQQRIKGERFALLFIDLDHFKRINDTLGHEQGDEVIRQIANHLRAQLPPAHFLCRRSGDEFIAVVDADAPTEAFRKNLQAIFKPTVFPVNGQGTVQITATFSAGAALCPDHSQTLHELLIYADTALLHAKESGRNQIQWLDARMMAATTRKSRVDAKLAQAIREGKIHPCYQPEVDLQSGKIIGFEALARWQDEELGTVTPAEFIPLAEQSGAIDPLTQSMFEQVVQDSRSIRARFPNTVMALNSSPQLLSGKRLFAMLSNLASEQDNGLAHFVLEITESDFDLSPQELAIQLQSIMGMGVRIAIDDFGKSYSSLSRLANMPIQKLKLDMSFTTGLDREENVKIVSGILALAQSLGLEVTAEGVENRFQRDTLLRLGCLQAQGYFYARPMPLRDVLALPPTLGPG
jgi:diguanylate cyclase (GGDEF)-like protein/PAS domain S-box-containing protein